MSIVSNKAGKKLKRNSSPNFTQISKWLIWHANLDVPPASKTEYIQVKIYYLSLSPKFIFPPVFPILAKASSILEDINSFFFPHHLSSSHPKWSLLSPFFKIPEMTLESTVTVLILTFIVSWITGTQILWISPLESAPIDLQSIFLMACQIIIEIYKANGHFLWLPVA